MGIGPPPLIERTLQLAEQLPSLDAVRNALIAEGYEDVDPFLDGYVVRAILRRFTAGMGFQIPPRSTRSIKFEEL
jgi:hypothetical protein